MLSTNTAMTKCKNLSEPITAKLLSYSVMASSLLSYSTKGNSQCGLAYPFNPILNIDIDQDGNNDLSIHWNKVYTSSAVPINRMTTVSNIQGYIGTINYPYAFPQTSTRQGCPVVIIDNPGPGVDFYGAYLNPISTILNAPFYVRYYGAVGTLTGSYIQGAYVASAIAYGNNEIIGLPSAGSNICSSLAVNGTSALNLGSALIGVTKGRLDIASFTYAIQFRGSFSEILKGTFTSHTPVTCTVATSILPAPNTFTVCANYFIMSNTYSLPNASNLALQAPFQSTNFVSPNTNQTNFLGVKFQGPDQDGDGNPDHYLGWVELYIDDDSSVFCLGTGYNTCSIEKVNADNGTSVNCPPRSEIQSAQADPGDCNLLCSSLVLLSGTAPMTLDQESTDWIRSFQTIPANGSVDYDAVDFIELRNNFCVPKSANFAAFIDGCNNGQGGFNVKNDDSENK